MMAPAPGSTGWLSVWTKALTQPKEETYAALAASPNAKASTGYLWYFLGALVSSLLASLVQGAVMGQMMQQFGLDGSQFGAGDIGSILITAICGAPIGAAIGTAIFAIGILIVQWIAGMFGGRGTNDQLVYIMSAILTPYLFINGLLALLSAIPYVGFCFSLVSLLGLLYVVVLGIMAVKGVNQFGWGAAAGSCLIPLLVIGFLCACLIAGAFMLLGPLVGNVFSSINQSLVP
jgi:hypothetical protein